MGNKPSHGQDMAMLAFDGLICPPGSCSGSGSSAAWPQMIIDSEATNTISNLGKGGSGVVVVVFLHVEVMEIRRRMPLEALS